MRSASTCSSLAVTRSRLRITSPNDGSNWKYPTRITQPFSANKNGQGLPCPFRHHTPFTCKRYLHTLRQVGDGVLDRFGRHIGMAGLAVLDPVLQPLDPFGDMGILCFGQRTLGMFECGFRMLHQRIRMALLAMGCR